MSNLLLAWRKARKGKTKKPYVIEFEKNVIGNLFQLQKELIEQTNTLKTYPCSFLHFFTKILNPIILEL